MFVEGNPAPTFKFYKVSIRESLTRNMNISTIPSSHVLTV